MKSKGWNDVVEAGQAIVKAKENFKGSLDFFTEIDEINEIIRNDSNKDSVIREKVFDYYYKIAVDKLKLENIRENRRVYLNVYFGDQNCYEQEIKEICKYSMEFIRTFEKVVDDPKIKEGVDEVAHQFKELIYDPSLSLLDKDKPIECRLIVDEISKWCEFPNYQQCIDRLNNN